MDVAIQETLFPLPEAAPAPTLATAWDRYRHWVAVSDQMGGLLPQNILPDLLGLSRARVSQLISDGRFTREILFGQTFVTADSLAEFVQAERKSGVHYKTPSMLALAKISLQVGRDVTGQK
jgi:hypothetical protein